MPTNEDRARALSRVVMAAHNGDDGAREFLKKLMDRFPGLGDVVVEHMYKLEASRSGSRDKQ